MSKQSNNQIIAEDGANVRIGNQRTINKNKTIIKGNKPIIVTVFLFVLVGIIYITMAHINNPSRQIVGRWKCTDNDKIYEFTKDGQMLYLSGSNNGLTIQYSVDKGQVRLDAKILWGSANVIADMDITGNKMTWSNFVDPEDLFSAFNDSSMNFTRVK